MPGGKRTVKRSSGLYKPTTVRGVKVGKPESGTLHTFRPKEILERKKFNYLADFRKLKDFIVLGKRQLPLKTGEFAFINTNTGNFVGKGRKNKFEFLATHKVGRKWESYEKMPEPKIIPISEIKSGYSIAIAGRKEKRKTTTKREKKSIEPEHGGGMRNF
ncbi:MAG: hypothetical protein ABIE23_03205 [archaeon]